MSILFHGAYELRFYIFNILFSVSPDCHNAPFRYHRYVYCVLCCAFPFLFSDQCSFFPEFYLRFDLSFTFLLRLSLYSLSVLERPFSVHIFDTICIYIISEPSSPIHDTTGIADPSMKCDNGFASCHYLLVFLARQQHSQRAACGAQLLPLQEGWISIEQIAHPTSRCKIVSVAM